LGTIIARALGDIMYENLSNNVKTRMSFTDLIGSGWNEVKQGRAILDFLMLDSSELATMNAYQRWLAYAESIDFLLTLLKNPVISFFVNPQSITVNKNVLLNKQNTKGGFVVQFWGHDLETISVKAETGYFGLSKVPLRAFELFKNYCYQGRYNSRKPFRSMPIMTMLYEGQALRGYFNNLTYTVVQQRPYMITYDFTFTVVENVTVPFLSVISNIYDTFNPQKYDTGKDIREKMNFAKGWGVKLY